MSTERDAVTGRETTGHEWDGIKELNTPLPKWWVYVFIATIVWSFGYWVVYPAWPGITGYTRGLLGYSTRGTFDETMQAATEGRRQWTDRLAAASVQDIAADPELLAYSVAGGRTLFAENCAPCHGSGGQAVAPKLVGQRAADKPVANNGFPLGQRRQDDFVHHLCPG